MRMCGFMRTSSGLTRYIPTTKKNISQIVGDKNETLTPWSVIFPERRLLEQFRMVPKVIPPIIQSEN